MNVARLNMSHGDHASHQKTIDLVKEYNAQFEDKVIAIMLDTKVCCFKMYFDSSTTDFLCDDQLEVQDTDFLYGGKGIVVPLKMRSVQFHSFLNFSLILYLIGLQCGAILSPLLSSLSSILYTSLIHNFIVIISHSCVHALCTQSSFHQ